MPFDYHYHLQGAMYRFKEIANASLSANLHYSHDIKTYTFSEIIVPQRKIDDTGIHILDGRAYLIYSSPSKDYVEAVVEGMLANPQLRIGRINFVIERVEVLPTPDISWSDVTFKTLSPIVLYTSSDGRKKDIPLYPTDTKWYVNLEKNLRHGFERFYGYIPGTHLTVETLRFKPKKYLFQKIQNDKILQGAIKAVHGHFRFRGDPHLIKFAYDAGVGERGAMGFGCLDIVK